MSTLYQVLYCSRNRVAGGPRTVAEEIDSILAKSRRNNGNDQVTGGLLFSDGCFAQVLEGPMEAVMAAFERIQCDERHSEVVVLQSGPIRERSFGDWSMAFAGSGPAASSPELPIVTASRDGEAMLALLRSVVVRETEWLEHAHA